MVVAKTSERKDGLEELREDAHVLLVLTGSLGDVARGCVVPTQLKLERPDLRLSWVVEDKWSPLVELCSAVDHVIPYSRKSSFYGVPKLWELLSQFGPFDCALDLQRHFKSGCFTRMSGAPRRIGFAPRDAKEGNWLFQTEYIVPCDMNQSKVYHYVSFVEKLIGTGNRLIEPLETRTNLFGIDRESAEALIHKLVPEKDSIWLTCALGSSWESKDWPVSGYQALLKLLQEMPRVKVFLAGDNSQRELGQKLVAINPGQITSLAGSTSLPQLLGLLSRSDVAVGPDTGTGHMASMVDTPYIGLFGPTDPRRVAPFRYEHLVLSAPVPCRPCGKRKCPGLQTACMRLLSPQKVLASIQDILAPLL